MLAVQEPPQAVMAPVTWYGSTAGIAIRFHHSQPRTRKFAAAARSSAGIAMAPATTLNKMYHCVPRIISGLNQIFGLSLNATIKDTATGNSTLAGTAARNCATGCTTLANCGRVPTQIPIGTQTTVARAISTVMRDSVARPSSKVVATSDIVMPCVTNTARYQKATAPSAIAMAAH